MTPVRTVWFAGGKGKVGIVQVKDDAGKVSYRIGAADGLLDKMDVLQLVAWGVEFPKAAGDALMKEAK